jgi:two-component system sensor histidine kinase SenX3
MGFGVAVVLLSAVLAIALDPTQRATTLTWVVVTGVLGLVVLGLVSVRMRQTLQGMARSAEADVAAALDAQSAENAQTRQLMEQALSVVGQGIVLIDGNDRVGYANPAAHELMKVSEGLRTLIPHSAQRLIREAREQMRTVEGDLQHGSPARSLRAAATPLHADGRVLLAVTDLTEPRRIEAARRDFVAAASHELKTPVAAILASSEALQLALTRDPGSAARFADQIGKSASQMARLVSDLLDLSRLEADAGAPERVRLEEVIAEEIGRVRSRAEAIGIQMSANLMPMPMSGTPADLALAVRNLLDNALRHTPKGGTIEVRMSTLGGEAVVEVADNGEGIPQRELPRIFERFYRVDAARARATGGTGLGLAIVKHVAERHGGSVSVQSELGAGSRFRLRLPI